MCSCINLAYAHCSCNRYMTTDHLFYQALFVDGATDLPFRVVDGHIN